MPDRPIRAALPLAASRRGLLRLAAGGAVSLAAGCSFPPRGPAVPNGDARLATVLGVPNERFFPAYGSDPLLAEFQSAQERRRARLGLGPDDPVPEAQLLAVSGGGENGAFGAGLLCGWSKHGDRPVFDLVTGVSTGALTAPFAFLGTAYDGPLREVYTELTPDHVLRRRSLTAALFDDGMADNTPLYNTIRDYLTPPMQAAIAEGYRQGRLLLIASTNLDAQQPVIWNIGAIAASDHPKALDLIRRLLLASSAIPGAFPPTMIDVTVDGKPFQEMHVDGGAFAQTFLYPQSMTRQRRARMSDGKEVPPAVAYVIRNGRLLPDWDPVDRRTIDIAGRAISTMISASGIGDVNRIYNVARMDGVEFKLAFISPDFTMRLPSPFDQAYMRALFDYGQAQGRAGYQWTQSLPV